MSDRIACVPEPEKAYVSDRAVFPGIPACCTVRLLMRRHPLGEAVDDLGELLRALLILKNAHHKEKGLRPLPIYTDCFLLYIGSHPDGVPMQELQNRFDLVHSSTSRTCAALASAGLVQISQSLEDRRQAVVKLTTRGQRVIDDVLNAFRGQRR